MWILRLLTKNVLQNAAEHEEARKNGGGFLGLGIQQQITLLAVPLNFHVLVLGCSEIWGGDFRDKPISSETLISPEIKFAYNCYLSSSRESGQETEAETAVRGRCCHSSLPRTVPWHLSQTSRRTREYIFGTQ